MTVPIPDRSAQIRYNAHFVWWGYVATLTGVIALVGEPIPTLETIGPERFTPVTWILSAATTGSLVGAFLKGGKWITGFTFVAGAFFLWRFVSLFYSEDPYKEVRMFIHAGHVVSLMLTHLTYGLLRVEKGVP